jgi:glycosyltransferase involved in cell wall biosynthesis
LKAALVHYWLVSRRGGERVLDAIASLLPEADLISHVVDPELLAGPLANRTVRQTFIHRLPWSRKRYAAYLPLMPIALEMMDMSSYDLIVSSESGPAKWVIKDPDAHHICYCHTPLRYIWDQRLSYMARVPAALRPVAHIYAAHLRLSDQASAVRVDQFVANSSFVARRIEAYYGREAVVIPPPVDTEGFRPSGSVGDYYLVAGELRHYKGVAVAVEACSRLGRPLLVMGGGDDRQLRRMAGPGVKFLGRVDDPTFKIMLANCRALLFPGVEDFGIVPVEAMASGRPVIALAKGGALDSVVHGETGILYEDASAEGLARAILEFESEEHSFRPEHCVARASRFSRANFIDAFSRLLPAGASRGVAEPGAAPRADVPPVREASKRRRTEASTAAAQGQV